MTEPDARSKGFDATRHTLLVVEDEDGVRLLTRKILERAGFKVLVAARPIEAEAIFFAAGRVDLLITDIVMPGGRGPDLFTGLHARQPSLRVLYMSGYSDDARFETNEDTPGAAFMEKPFTAETLLGKVREVLND